MTTVTLYIEPDKGPIKPISIDLMEIEQAVRTTYRTSVNREQERQRLICAKIKQQFPYVEPESNLNGLSLVLARFSYADQLNGWVLRLKGVIESDPVKVASPNGQVVALQQEISNLTQTVVDLRGQLLKEQNANLSDKAQAQQLASTNQNLVQQRAKDYNEIVRLTMQQQQDQQKIQALNQEIQRLNSELASETQRLQVEAENALRAASASQLRYEQFEMQSKLQYQQLEQQYKDVQKQLRQRENELVKLRQEATVPRESEELLRNEIARQQKEIDDLKQRLINPTSSGDAKPGGVLRGMLP
jgi:chromosome segregation ATPase